MSKTVQWKRGNTTINSTYTGAVGEITVNTDNWNLHVHDGVTAGGYVIDSSNGGSSFTNITVTSNANVNGILFANTLTASGNLILSSNTSVGGITVRRDSGKMGFNTDAFGNTTGYTFNFSGNLYSSDGFFTNASGTGYAFDTAGNVTGLTHVTNGDSTTSLQLVHNGTYVAKFTDNGATLLDGNLTISSNDAYGIQFPDAPVKAFSNTASYSQFVHQNLSNNSAASSDFVATADNGTDSTYFIDMGINSSTFAQDYWFPGEDSKNAGYLYVVGYDAAGPSTGNVGNLIIGSTNGVVKTFVGNTTDANVVTTVSQGQFTVTGNVTASNLIATTRTYANTAIFGYGTDGSGLVGAPVYISGNSTQALIGTNGIAGNVTSSLTVKTLNSNISLQITGADKTWTFDTAGNLTAPGTVIGNLRTNEAIIALGDRAGSSNQGNLSVAIGSQAGQTDQGIQATAIGSGAGATSQAAGATAIGALAGAVNQGLRAVAIGSLAGSSGQGEYAVAIGNFAGGTNQANNSIILNATGISLDASTSGFFVAPIAANTAGNVVTYNTSTKELTYSDTISISGNVTAGNINTSGTITATGPVLGQYFTLYNPYYYGDLGFSGGNLAITANVGFQLFTDAGVSGEGGPAWTFGTDGATSLPGNLITANTYVPSANNSVGTTGQITWDGDYVYICVATDTWKRANLSTW